MGGDDDRRNISAGYVLVASAVAQIATGCAQPRVRYHGAEHPQIAATGDDVKVFGGHREAPHRHEVIGTVVASSSFASEDEIVQRFVRPRAAQVGGTAIHRVDCETRTQQDDEGVDTFITTCGANVLRALDAGRPVDLKRHGDEVMELEHTQVAIAHPAIGPRLGEELDHAGVGILDTHPIEYAYFGMTAATCVGSCPRSTLSRAMRIAAAKRGALAIAELECDLDGAVSRCTATLVGPELDSVVGPETPSGRDQRRARLLRISPVSKPAR